MVENGFNLIKEETTKNNYVFQTWTKRKKKEANVVIVYIYCIKGN